MDLCATFGGIPSSGRRLEATWGWPMFPLRPSQGAENPQVTSVKGLMVSTCRPRVVVIRP